MWNDCCPPLSLDVEIAMIDSVEINSLLLRASEFGVLTRPELRPRLTNSITVESDSLPSTQPVQLCKGLSVSSSDLASFNSDGQMTDSTDTINQLESMLPRPTSDRKRDKGLRLSLPTALNSAGDKIFGKRRSNSTSKLKVGAHSEKKEKGKLKDMLNSGFGLKKSSSQDKLPEVPKSGSSEDNEPLKESLEECSDPSSDNLEFTGKIVFKHRYTPVNERQFDPWYSGAPDAPLADPEGDSPLFTEPPSRSFPLSHTPNRYTGDYDTAFALASIHGDGLSYLSKINSVSETGYRRSPNKDISEHRVAGKKPSINIICACCLLKFPVAMLRCCFQTFVWQCFLCGCIASYMLLTPISSAL